MTRSARSAYLLSFAMLVIGLGLSFVAFRFVAQNVRNEAQLKFERQASDSHHKIEARVRAYIDIMHGLGSLFRISSSITRAEFHSYVTGLDLPRRFPGFQNINFAEQVSLPAIPAFIARVRSDRSMEAAGYPGFVIKPPGERPEYHVITYLEPMAGNEVSFGVDIMGLGKERREAIEHMRDSAQLYSSGRTVVVAGPSKHIGLAMRLPVFRADVPLGTAQERRAAFLGSLGAGFRVKDVMQGVLDPGTLDYLRFRLYDAGPLQAAAVPPKGNEAERLLFDSKDLPETPDRDAGVDPDSDLRTTFALTVAGRKWEVQFSAPTEKVVGSATSLLPPLVLAGGIVVSVLLFGMTYALASSRGRAVSLAEEITRDLKLVSRRLVEVQEAERRTLASELHDRVGQNLSALGLNLRVVAGDLSATDASSVARLEESEELLGQTISRIRNVMEELRPQGLDSYGVDASLQPLTKAFAARTGIATQVDSSGMKVRPPKAIELAMFRIAQEALNNIAKHAQARHVTISYASVENQATLTIEDDGVGFDLGNGPARTSEGWGLQIMRERAEAAGATLSIETAPGKGARVIVRYRT